MPDAEFDPTEVAHLYDVPPWLITSDVPRPRFARLRWWLRHDDPFTIVMMAGLAGLVLAAQFVMMIVDPWPYWFLMPGIFGFMTGMILLASWAQRRYGTNY